MQLAQTQSEATIADVKKDTKAMVVSVMMRMNALRKIILVMKTQTAQIQWEASLVTVTVVTKEMAPFV